MRPVVVTAILLRPIYIRDLKREEVIIGFRWMLLMRLLTVTIVENRY